MSMNLNLNAFVSLKIRSVDYRCIINWISRSEVVDFLQNADLSEKVDYYFIAYKRWIKNL